MNDHGTLIVTAKDFIRSNDIALDARTQILSTGQTNTSILICIEHILYEFCGSTTVAEEHKRETRSATFFDDIVANYIEWMNSMDCQTVH